LPSPYPHRIELETLDDVKRRLADPGATWSDVTIQNVDLTLVGEELAKRPLAGCVFLGCALPPVLAASAVAAGCLIVPDFPGLPFEPFRSSVYTAGDLYDKFDPDDPEESYRASRDSRIYQSYIDPAAKSPYGCVPVELALARRIHDHSVSEALEDFLERVKASSTFRGLVGVMGGHAMLRAEKADEGATADAPYLSVALLAHRLAGAGYVVMTGGGPGAMEAANLGAYLSTRSEDELRQAVRMLAPVPKIETGRGGAWVKLGFDVRERWPIDQDPSPLRQSVGIPTWFYGHEPPNVFATHIAKYFENSLREEGLLSIATHGVIFAPGNAGTVQEIFQDAAQNYYKTYAHASPMVLLGKSYWNPGADSGPEQRLKPAYPLLRQLAIEKDFTGLVLLTDDIREAEAFIRGFTPPQPAG
jgi:predicted Rossmann-fold nucleotide-binding protein